MSKEQTYKNIGSLKPLENLVAAAKEAVSDPSRTKASVKEINAVLGAVGGAAVGGAASFAALYAAGITGLSAAGITSGLAALGIGGGMIVGMGVLCLPVAGLGVVGYALIAHRNKKKLVEKKEMLLQEVLRKHNEIITELKKTSQKNKERLEYLNGLNTLLQAALRDLRSDLGVAA